MNEIGLGLILSGILAIPGSIVGHTLARNSPIAKAMAYIVESWVTTLEAYKKIEELSRSGTLLPI